MIIEKDDDANRVGTEQRCDLLHFLSLAIYNEISGQNYLDNIKHAVWRWKHWDPRQTTYDPKVDGSND